jgi:hypothetical protein
MTGAIAAGARRGRDACLGVVVIKQREKVISEFEGMGRRGRCRRCKRCRDDMEEDGQEEEGQRGRGGGQQGHGR